ncbi:hypothetical protein GCM10014719_03990 [Planomonospora parontospora subsp. antibiotica]|nr:hypothetical protein GCM10014719_03990 [Planomonospora parontospora subsp. antibiotica]GII14380.1 hypothetical protein Ppa05_11060 [Planomonospora parontospora subsp. antibiotica]
MPAERRGQRHIEVSGLGNGQAVQAGGGETAEHRTRRQEEQRGPAAEPEGVGQLRENVNVAIYPAEPGPLQLAASQS